MKVGIFVTNQNPLGTDMVSALDEQFAMTRLVRDRGWDAVGTGQHYLSEGMSQLQLVPFLGRLAAEAGEMTAGPYLGAKYRAYASWGQDAVLPDGDSFRQPFEELLRDRFVLGSPEECYEQLRPCWEAVGANFLFFRTHWLGMPLAHALASMRLMSDELLPALRQVSG